MIKITNTGNGEIILPIGGGTSLMSNGGVAIVKSADWDALMASDEFAKSLADTGVITVDKAEKADKAK